MSPGAKRDHPAKRNRRLGGPAYFAAGLTTQATSLRARLCDLGTQVTASMPALRKGSPCHRRTPAQ